MLRNLAFVVGYAVILILSTTASVWAADFGTAEVTAIERELTKLGA